MRRSTSKRKIGGKIQQPLQLPNYLEAHKYDYLFKLLLIGDSNVGKTCVLLRLTTNAINTTYVSTIGIDFKIRTIELNGKKIKLQIWDTSGQEFHTTMTECFRGATGVILVYDVTNVKSFVKIKSCIRNVEENAPDGVEKILLGNKCELDNERLVSKEEGKALASMYDIKFMEISAKMNINVEEAIFDLVRNIMAKMEKRLDTSNLPKNGGHQLKTVKPLRKSLSSSRCSIV